MQTPRLYGTSGDHRGRRLIIKRASATVVKNQAITEGMKTLRMVGIEKAREGITTLEEVLKNTSDDH